MTRRGSVWLLLVGALLAALLTGATATSAGAVTGDGTRYYFAADPDNGFGGYVVRIRFAGDRAYLRAPAWNRACMKATRAKATTWRYKEPIAAEYGDPVPSRFKTNKARTTVKFDNQYEDYNFTYRQISRAQADRWLRKIEPSASWSRRC